MTDYGNILLLVIILPIVGFMLGSLWNDVEHQIKKERELECKK